MPSRLPLDVLSELEACNGRGGLASVLTVLLLGSECSYRCLMCDLWKSTHLQPTPVGNIPAQIRFAIEQPTHNKTANSSEQQSLPQWIKLYNASNFFAPTNVPTEDLVEIANLVQGYERVIVENHPRLTHARVRKFADCLTGKLEVAMGLETIEPRILASLNKQLTVEVVQRAVDWLLSHEIDVRLFVLLRPPGCDEQAGLDWCHASIAAARRWGVRHVSVIPVRTGNGALEHLQLQGHFEPPLASSLERILEQNVGRSSMIVTADLWDWQRLRGLCDNCSDARRNNLQQINLTQCVTHSTKCECDQQLL